MMQTVPHPNKWFMSRFDRFEPAIQDSTQMKELKACDRKYFYRMVLGRVAKKQKYQANLDWGTARHKFRETLELTDGDVQKALAVALAVKIAEPEGKKFAFLSDKTRLMKMLAKDTQNYDKEKEQKRIKVLSVEQPINCELPDGTLIGGKTDQQIMLSGGLWDRDWKTSSKEKEYFAKEKEVDDQGTRYIYILSKLHGKLIDGVIFDVMQNLATVENNHYTHIVSKTPKQLEMWEREQIHLNKQLKMNRDADIWPMREGKCQFCEYFWVCKQPNEQAQMAKLQSDYELKPWDHTNINGENDE